VRRDCGRAHIAERSRLTGSLPRSRSLRVNLDMGKTVYAHAIQTDSEIPGTIVRTSTLPEELGRIEYLLSDKVRRRPCRSQGQVEAGADLHLICRSRLALSPRTVRRRGPSALVSIRAPLTYHFPSRRDGDEKTSPGDHVVRPGLIRRGGASAVDSNWRRARLVPAISVDLVGPCCHS
jgi:hypothetical protein